MSGPGEALGPEMGPGAQKGRNKFQKLGSAPLGLVILVMLSQVSTLVACTLCEMSSNFNMETGM